MTRGHAAGARPSGGCSGSAECPSLFAPTRSTYQAWTACVTRFADTGRIPSASAACRGIVMEAISAAAEVPAIAALAASFAAARARREAAPPTWPAPGGRGHLRLAASDGKRR